MRQQQGVILKADSPKYKEKWTTTIHTQQGGLQFEKNSNCIRDR